MVTLGYVLAGVVIAIVGAAIGTQPRRRTVARQYGAPNALRLNRPALRVSQHGGAS